MSVPLPASIVLLGNAELGLLQRLVLHYQLEVQEHLNEFKAAMRVRLAELDALELTRVSIDTWTEKTVSPMVEAVTFLFPLLQRPELIDQVAADFEQQRAEIRAFLRRISSEAAGDWALVVLQLYVAKGAEEFKAQQFKMPTSEEIERLSAQPEMRRTFGIMFRLMGFLTLILEAARAGLEPTERHATYAALAFFDAKHLTDQLALHNMVIDPIPYLDKPRNVLAREALLRLMRMPVDEETKSYFTEMLGR